MQPTRLVGAIALLLLLGWASAGATGTPAATGIGVVLTASPLNGTAPLVVTFHASVTPTGTLATFAWTFGDGQSYSQTTTGNSSPAHSYASPGIYVANVSVTSASGDANATLTVRVVAENLVASVEATPATGTAPLTVNFTSKVSGGTGTYQSILWNFGDGDSGSGASLVYTYPLAGTFTVTLVVTDSSGHSVSATTRIVVLSGPTPPGGGGSALDRAIAAALPYVLVAAAALSAIAIVVVVGRYLRLRRSGEVEAPPGAFLSPPESPPSWVAEGSEAPIDAGGTPASPTEESRRLSERILIHLLWFGRRDSAGFARAEASQQGISKALGSGQNSVSKALSRLIDAGAVRVELSHVPGAPRRVKTYALTSRGEAVARSMSRGPAAARPTPPSDS